MKTKITVTILVILLSSCAPSITPMASSEIHPIVSTQVPSEIPIQINFPTPTFTFTPIPITILPLSTQTTKPVVTLEPASLMLNPTRTKIFVIGITNEGERNYSLGDGTPFRILYEPQDGFMSLHFSVNLSSRLKDEFTQSQITSLTSGWRIQIYRYRIDEIYSNQPVLILDDLQAETDTDFPTLSIDVKKEELQAKFGDCRAFTFQLVDEKGNLEQGNFVLNPNAGLDNSDEVRNAVNIGVLIGYPYSVYENETAFFRQGKFITIHEPAGGFYRLYYIFNFVLATGITTTSEQEAEASNLTIRLFPYQENGEYFSDNFYPLLGEVDTAWGGFTLDLPIDYLNENVVGNNSYYLQIVDGKGNIIKDEYFIFVPYTA